MIVADGEPLTSAQRDLKVEYEYIRATVIVKEGRKAWTNPIFIK